METVSKKTTLYHIAEGYQIDEIIGNSINESKRKFFQEVGTPSLNKILRYCYANTYDRYGSTDGCYFCVTIDYVHEEFHRRRETINICSVLHQRKSCCLCYDCQNSNKLHYLL